MVEVSVLLATYQREHILEQTIRAFCNFKECRQWS
jgi:hypothetical protein